uniref:MSP domain-containing protein n=1 Tax=Gongylonema pulchrum TaxID=637853 RepID=A0A183DII9_9BILA
LYYSQSESRKPFIINPETGELKPSPFVRFDREQRAQEEVTVKVSIPICFQNGYDINVNDDNTDVNDNDVDNCSSSRSKAVRG